MNPAVVLAAGSSTRMGSPKALLRCGDKSFIDTILQNIKAAGFQPIIVVLGEDFEQIAADITFSGGYELVRNSRPERGQLSSLQEALSEIPGNSIGCLVALVDHPLVQISTYQELKNRAAENPASILIPVCNGKRGHPVFFGSRFFEELQKTPLAEGARRVVADHADRVIEVNTGDAGILRDIDTPQLYERYGLKGNPDA